MKVSRTFGSMARGVGLFMLFLLLYPLVTCFILIFILSLSVRRWLPTEGSGDSLDSFLNLCAAALAGAWRNRGRDLAGALSYAVCFETMPSQPNAQACLKMTAPSPR
jgi:hypothetical protein